MMALFRKELREHLLSRRGLFIFFIISLLYSVLTFSFISVKELSLLAQVEVNMTFLKMMLGVSSLMLIVIGSIMVSGEKEKGTLESLLLTPLSKLRMLMSKLLAIVIFWLVLIVLSVPYLLALTMGTDLLPVVMLYVVFNGTLLVLSFGGIALAISAWASSTKGALLLSIMIFFVSVIPMFLSTTNKKVGFAHMVDQSSPVSSSMLAMKDAMVNKMGVAMLAQDSLPVAVFFVLMVLILLFASSKVNFLGGE